jgi:UPF0755 protein
MSSIFPTHRHQDGFIGRLLLIIILGIMLCVWFVRAAVLPPVEFPVKTTFVVEQGDDLGTIAYNLQTAHLIKSAEVFKLMMLALGSAEHVSVGAYYFEVPVTSIEVALKISGNEFGILQHRVTFPEGFTNTEIAARLTAKFSTPERPFDTAKFLSLAADKQGYLFPDTYGFDPHVTPETVIATLTQTFTEKTAPLEAEFTASSRSRKDIIIMASILEKEAANAEEMPMIAGILWKRIDRGIALQVDAPLTLMLGKTSAELTVTDLAMKSPYNTYVHKGLPPAPIDNPGLDAISAALHPVSSPYLYYLHDSKGTVHYASTFEEHKANKQKYLN